MTSHALDWEEQLVVITRKRQRVLVEAHSVSAQVVTFLHGDWVSFGAEPEAV